MNRTKVLVAAMMNTLHHGRLEIRDDEAELLEGV